MVKPSARRLPPSSIEIEVSEREEKRRDVFEIPLLCINCMIIKLLYYGISFFLSKAVKVPSQLICRFYFLDGKAKAMGVDPSATASDVIKSLASRVDLQSSDGWGLFEVNPDREHFIKGHDYISDILSQWERSAFLSTLKKF